MPASTEILSDSEVHPSSLKLRHALKVQEQRGQLKKKKPGQQENILINNVSQLSVGLGWFIYWLYSVKQNAENKFSALFLL